MTRSPLLLPALLALVLFSATACRHNRAAASSQPQYSHEEAEPVSNLPQEEFSRVTPQRGRRH